MLLDTCWAFKSRNLIEWKNWVGDNWSVHTCVNADLTILLKVKSYISHLHLILDKYLQIIFFNLLLQSLNCPILTLNFLLFVSSVVISVFNLRKRLFFFILIAYCIQDLSTILYNWLLLYFMHFDSCSCFKV